MTATRIDHYAEAERLAAQAGDGVDDELDTARAQVHATLALTDATVTAARVAERSMAKR